MAFQRYPSFLESTASAVLLFAKSADCVMLENPTGVGWIQELAFGHAFRKAGQSVFVYPYVPL